MLTPWQVKNSSCLASFSSGNWLFNHNGDGESFEQIVFGEPSGIPLTGDWDGDGHGDLAVVKTGRGNGSGR